mmetsp:Transcript_34248/g.50837  ORF Transcript_34248/g.50837 Transcript_34248/m.50837 type:complete len:91 (+) Transcript_34248:763-1035(+)
MNDDDEGEDLFEGSSGFQLLRYYVATTVTDAGECYKLPDVTSGAYGVMQMNVPGFVKLVPMLMTVTAAQLLPKCYSVLQRNSGFCRCCRC